MISMCQAPFYFVLPLKNAINPHNSPIRQILISIIASSWISKARYKEVKNLPTVSELPNGEIRIQMQLSFQS